MRIAYNPLYKSDGKTKVGALTSAPINDIVFDLPGKSIWAKGLKFLGTDSLKIIIGSSSDTVAGTWTGQHSEIGRYEDGLTIIYIPKVAGASTTTLNINGLGAKTCYYSGTSKLTTHYPAGTPILFTYYNDGWRRADYNANINNYRPIEVNDTSLLGNDNYILNFKSDGNISYVTTAATSTSKLADLIIGIDIDTLKTNLGISLTINNSSTHAQLPTSKAVYDFVGNYLTSYMHWKGNTPSSGTTFTIPNAAVVGDAYRIAVAGTIPAANSITGLAQVVEVGDIIICTDTTGPKYTIAQTNWTTVAGTSTLAWNSEVTLATIGGLAIKAKLPTNPTLALKSISFTKADGTAVSYNGSSTVDLTGGINYATLANLVRNNLIIKLNGGTTEGTNLFTYNGSVAKTINITPASIGAATFGHTHTTTIAASTDTNQIALVYGGKYKLTAGGTSYVFTMPASDNTWRPIGTGATDAAAGNHIHKNLIIKWGAGDTEGTNLFTYNGSTAKTINLSTPFSLLFTSFGNVDTGFKATNITATVSGVTKSFAVNWAIYAGRSQTADKWTTARTLTIGNTGKSVDGSANVSWSLAEIGVSAAAHTHSVKINGATKTIAASNGAAVDLGNYLPLSGGTMSGPLTFANGTWNLMGDDAYIGDCNVAGMIGVKGANAATPGFALYNNSGALLGKLYASNDTLNWSGGKIAATIFSGNATSAECLNNYSISDPNTQAIKDVKVKWFAQINSTTDGNSGYAGNNYGFPVSNNANGILYLGTHPGKHGHQLGFSSNGNIYHRFQNGSDFPLTTNGGSWASLITSNNIASLSVNYASSSGTCNGNAKGLYSSGYGNSNLTYYQTDGSFFGNSGWSHYIIANHRDGSNYFNFTIGLPFWGVPIYKRLEEGTADGWHTFITSENISSQSVNYAASAGSVAWSNVSGRPDMSKYVPKNYNNIAYSDVTAKYVRDSTPTYFRIIFPDRVLSMWNMVNIEIFVRLSYNSEYGGKILICTHNNSGNTWNPFRASTHGPLTTSIKVYGSGGKYLYIGGCGAYSTISIDKILIGDVATNYDISDISIDYVTSLPSTYQTATMYYDINSLNIGSQSVNYANSAGSVAWDNITGKPSSFTPASHNHSQVLDIGNSSATTFAYSKSGLNYDDYTLLAGWNGYELRAINKAQFAQASHSHSNYAVLGTYNNLTHSGNEFTFASAAFSGEMWINYRTASGSTNGDITRYYFGNGKAGYLAYISSGYFSGTAAAANSVAWGNITGKPSTFTPSDHYHNYFPENTAVYFRAPNNAICRGGMYWGSAGKEALCFVAANADTSFRFFTGSDLANWTSSTWQGTPAFEVNKNGAYAPHFYESSDIRYKTIINNLAIKANQLANLPLFDFKWLDNEDLLNTGTSAQAVQEILPNLVSGTDKLTLDYGVLGTIAGITACKELVTLKSEIELLKYRIELLEQQLKMYHGNSK